MTPNDAASALEQGMQLLKKRPTKRKRQTNEASTPEAALEQIKKGVRYSSVPSAASRNVVAAVLSALDTVPPPLSMIVQICRSLFERSKAFRNELVGQLRSMCHRLEIKQLYNVEILDMLQAWDTQYGAVYPQLRAAVAAIPAKWTALQRKRDDAIATAASSRREIEEVRAIQFDHMMREVEAGEAAIVDHIESMERTCAMLVPTVEDCFSALLPAAKYAPEDDDDEVWEDVLLPPPIDSWSLPDVIESCGLGSAAYTISIPVPDIVTPDDLELLHATLQEQVDEIERRFQPKVQSWIQTARTRPASAILHRLEKLQHSLESVLAKAKAFNKPSNDNI
ncbi:unnamed protein product [Aphanomyces euteiches]